MHVNKKWSQTKPTYGATNLSAASIVGEPRSPVLNKTDRPYVENVSAIILPYYIRKLVACRSDVHNIFV